MMLVAIVPLWVLVLWFAINAVCEIALVTEEKPDRVYEAYKNWSRARSEGVDLRTYTLLKRLAATRS
jgi:hypothetical protein